MIAAKVLSAILIFGTLKDASCWGNGWGREIGRVWRDWREEPVFVKRCSLYEMLGFCPSNDPTVCILGHPLVTGKECGHCSEAIWFAYKEGICAGDELSELAEETGNHYYRHHYEENRPESEREKERELEHREEELEQELEFPVGETFESGSGVMGEETTETSFTPYSMETQIEVNENEGSYSTEESGMAPMAGKGEKKESLIDRIRSYLDNVGDIFS